MDVSRSIVPSALVAVAGALAWPSTREAQCTAGTGSWSPIYNWESQINVAVPCGTGGASLETEFAHAALIPRGLRKGQVLLWRRERKSDTECGQGDTDRTWIFNPETPGTLYEIEQGLPSDIFCSGHTWDLHGQLIVAGGNTAENTCAPSCPFPSETYRFRPQFERIFANAVILPTGEILIEGGDHNDTQHPFHPLPTGTTKASVPAYNPIIYDPELLQTDPGAFYVQPMDGPSPDLSYPRLYHHVAALLLDGSVFIAGGRRKVDANGSPVPSTSSGTEPDPRFTGEIFLPPYLDFLTTGRSRPVVETLPPSQISFSEGFTINQFEMQVDHSDDATIDSVVLLRPAAVTHHFDNDQRYIELNFTATTENAEPGRKLSTLDIDAPDESLGPPGYYMIFAIEAHTGCTQLGHRVPTQGRFIRIL